MHRKLLLRGYASIIGITPILNTAVYPGDPISQDLLFLTSNDKNSYRPTLLARGSILVVCRKGEERSRTAVLSSSFNNKNFGI